MRYLGNKTKLLFFIEKVIDKYKITGDTFADLFAGTCSVGDYFKDRYKIIANDYMTFSAVISKAKLYNDDMPKFLKFKKIYKKSPFDYLNEKEYSPNEDYFIYNNYTPVGNRMYFKEENAIKIDGMRIEIEQLYNKEEILENEYYYLLASLLESVLKVSNTTGTYQAFLKFWESRSLKKFKITPIEINNTKLKSKNIVYNENTNNLVKNITGDIAYIDTPYTINQYTNSYHILETIAKYDNPVIFGKTGRRKKRELSAYSNKSKAIHEFEDLFRQINFKHILVSYSNQSIIPLNELIELAQKFAVDNKVYVEYQNYREYATNNLSYKDDGTGLKEVIIYFEKNNAINKSPLNYSGSKDQIVPNIIKYLPKHIDCFVDAMGGAFNVGANIVTMNSVVYNEYNPYIFNIVRMLIQEDSSYILKNVENIVEKYKLKKKDKEAYLKLRNAYNENKETIILFTLQIYAFQNMIRFNSNHQFNTPVGNNEYCSGIKNRIIEFKPRVDKIELFNDTYKNIDYKKYPIDTVFYFDPPYFITKAEYNDGKRGLEGWNLNSEKEMLEFLKKIHEAGYKFMLSNVIQHNGKEHILLKKWVEDNNFKIYTIGKTGKKYPREEVLVVNY